MRASSRWQGSLHGFRVCRGDHRGLVQRLAAQVLPDVGVNIELRSLRFDVRRTSSASGLDVVHDVRSSSRTISTIPSMPKTRPCGVFLPRKVEVHFCLGNRGGHILELAPIEQSWLSAVSLTSVVSA
jgi:hypothetical protein